MEKYEEKGNKSNNCNIFAICLSRPWRGKKCAENRIHRENLTVRYDNGAYLANNCAVGPGGATQRILLLSFPPTREPSSSNVFSFACIYSNVFMQIELKAHGVRTHFIIIFPCALFAGRDCSTFASPSELRAEHFLMIKITSKQCIHL